ncbi:MAG: 3-oxoacyl-ACP synthase III [Deltaproteobacteria bacterium]|nr:3-oxoacyl-ACP synthase III [Deltaproteobacteria bacterium]
MRFRNVCIEETGCHLPETVLTSSEIEQQLAALAQQMNLMPGFLKLLTGVEERRIWPPGTRPSGPGSMAARNALQKAELRPEEVDLLIHTGVCRDSLEPATASVIHAKLGLSPHCMPFDLSNACLGFLNGLWVAAHMIESGSVRTALIVSAENSAPVYQSTIAALREKPEPAIFRRYLANLTLGSAAVAFIMRHREDSKNGHHLLGGACQTDNDSWSLCEGNGNLYHQHMETDTAALMKKGLILSRTCWELFRKNLAWEDSTPDLIFNHQVSLTHQDKVFRTLGLAPEKSCGDVNWLGNTGTAAAPLSLALRAEKQELISGQSLAILGIGSGLNCLMLGVSW